MPSKNKTARHIDAKHRFVIYFESLGFTTDESWGGFYLSPDDITKLVEDARAKNLLTGDILDIHEGGVADDDEVEDGERKVYVKASIVVELEEEAEAVNFEPPVELLNLIADGIEAAADASGLSREDDWENTDYEAAEMAGA